MKHRASYLIELLFMCTITSASSQSISPTELSIGGVTVGHTEHEVKKTLGAPKSRNDSGEGITLGYAGLKVDVGAGDYGVYDISSTGAKYCTPSKVCPGMLMAHVLHLYGEPMVAERETGTFFEYRPNESTCWLQITAPKGVVRSLRVACQP